MEETLQKESLTTNQENILNYFKAHDPKYIAEDAIFRNLATGEVYTGREEVTGMLHFMYHVAFDAKAEVVNTIITEDKAAGCYVADSNDGRNHTRLKKWAHLFI